MSVLENWGDTGSEKSWRGDREITRSTKVKLSNSNRKTPVTLPKLKCLEKNDD